jgi:hypothetical protein
MEVCTVSKLLPDRRKAGVAAAGVVTALMMSGAAYATQTITFAGGNASKTVDCRNVSDSGDEQKNRCEATAEGGDVSLKNVELFLRSGSSIEANGGEVDVVDVGGGDAEAGAKCINAGGDNGKQKNRCRARAVGGAVKFRRLEIVVHHENGSKTFKRRDLAALRTRPSRSRVVCRGNDQSECETDAGGGTIVIRNVDMLDLSTNVTHNDIHVSIQGGDAQAFVSCGNFAEGGGRQVNRCSAIAIGGDAILEDVKLHVYK